MLVLIYRPQIDGRLSRPGQPERWVNSRPSTAMQCLLQLLTVQTFTPHWAVLLSTLESRINWIDSRWFASHSQRDANLQPQSCKTSTLLIEPLCYCAALHSSLHALQVYIIDSVSPRLIMCMLHLCIISTIVRPGTWFWTRTDNWYCSNTNIDLIIPSFSSSPFAGSSAVLSAGSFAWIIAVITVEINAFKR